MLPHRLAYFQGLEAKAGPFPLFSKMPHVTKVIPDHLQHSSCSIRFFFFLVCKVSTGFLLRHLEKTEFRNYITPDPYSFQGKLYPLVSQKIMPSSLRIHRLSSFLHSGLAISFIPADAALILRKSIEQQTRKSPLHASGSVEPMLIETTSRPGMALT
jgi:hypothetical protein